MAKNYSLYFAFSMIHSRTDNVQKHFNCLCIVTLTYNWINRLKSTFKYETMISNPFMCSFYCIIYFGNVQNHPTLAYFWFYVVFSLIPLYLSICCYLVNKSCRLKQTLTNPILDRKECKVFDWQMVTIYRQITLSQIQKFVLIN